jgi:hypothetical protein
MTQYYEYLVAGMPDIQPDGGRSAGLFKAFMSDVDIIVEPPDSDVVAAMRLPIDNRNLINVLEGKDGFDDRGNYSREVLEEATKTLSGVPEYMEAFLVTHRENRLPFPGLTAIDQLTWLFYEEMASSENEFLREWYDFDVSLRNVIAGINLRKGLTHIEAIATERDHPPLLTIVGRATAAEAVLKSTAPDFGLSGEYPWVEKVLALAAGGLTAMEKGLDDLRWETLNELTAYSLFDIEVVAAFTQKIIIVERWMKLEPEEGRARLDKLVKEMMGSFVMPAGF